MEYLLLFIALTFCAYYLVTFKKKPNTNWFKIYDNSKYYTFLFMLVVGTIALILSLFVPKGDDEPAYISGNIHVINKQQKLTGTYTIDFFKDHKELNGTIKVKGDTYKKTLANGKTVKGDITYDRGYVFLQDKDSDIKIEFFIATIGNDTLPFGIRKSGEMPDTDDLMIHSGQLVNIKR